MFAPLETSIHIAWNIPSLPVAIPLLLFSAYGLSLHSAWYSIVAQMIPATVFAYFFWRFHWLGERWRILRWWWRGRKRSRSARMFPKNDRGADGFDIHAFVDVAVATISCAAFSFVYPLERNPRDPDSLSSLYGPPCAVAMALSCSVLAHAARRLWIEVPRSEPSDTSRNLELMIDITVLVAAIDCIAFPGFSGAKGRTSAALFFPCCAVVYASSRWLGPLWSSLVRSHRSGHRGDEKE